MEVDLIDYTGCGHPDPLYAGRILAYAKNTRLEQGPGALEMWMQEPEEKIFKELEYIADTIRSSWEFVHFTFSIRGVTRAFTHQFVRTRTASYAQQSQRSVDMDGFEVELPETVQKQDESYVVWQNTIDRIKEAYRVMRRSGIPAQDARGILPTNIHTNILMNCNLRTLADTVAKRENLRAQGEYVEVARRMREAVEARMPWTKPFLEPERLQTPNLDAMLKEALGTASPIDQPKINAVLKEVDKLKAVWG